MLKLRKNLRDSFAMVLEEMENVVGGEIVGQTDEEIKILEEEAVKQGVEIQQDLAAVEECCADIETLQKKLVFSPFPLVVLLESLYPHNTLL